MIVVVALVFVGVVRVAGYFVELPLLLVNGVALS